MTTDRRPKQRRFDQKNAPLSQSRGDGIGREGDRADGDRGSVTQWILDVAEYCDQDAAHDIFERYFDQLVKQLQCRVQRKLQAVENAEDLAAYALSEILHKLPNGGLPDLRDRKGLWSLMISIADYRMRQVHRGETQAKRNRDRTISVDQAVAPSNSVGRAFEIFTSSEPSPDFVASISEQLEYLLNALSSDEYRDLLLWELAGYSPEEMRRKLSAQKGYEVLDRAIRRKRARMRQELQTAFRNG